MLASVEGAFILLAVLILLYPAHFIAIILLLVAVLIWAMR